MTGSGREDGPLRVVVTGSESTGKTTLAAQLAAHFGAALVPEFSRRYAEEVGRPLVLDDHTRIARGQMAAEDEQVARATPPASGRALVVQDTDLLSTVVYACHYYGSCARWVMEEARSRRPDLYLLLDVDVPWVSDGVRDRGSDAARAEVQRLFRDAVVASGAPFVSIGGSWEERLRRSIAAVRDLLAG